MPGLLTLNPHALLDDPRLFEIVSGSDEEATIAVNILCSVIAESNGRSMSCFCELTSDSRMCHPDSAARRSRPRSEPSVSEAYQVRVEVVCIAGGQIYTPASPNSCCPLISPFQVFFPVTTTPRK